MSGHEWSERYEAAIERLSKLVQKDGRGHLYLPVENGREVGVDDPVVLADFKRSLEETNKKVDRGEFRVGQTWTSEQN